MTAPLTATSESGYWEYEHTNTAVSSSMATDRSSVRVTTSRGSSEQLPFSQGDSSTHMSLTSDDPTLDSESEYNEHGHTNTAIPLEAVPYSGRVPSLPNCSGQHDLHCHRMTALLLQRCYPPTVFSPAAHDSGPVVCTMPVPWFLDQHAPTCTLSSVGGGNLSTTALAEEQ